MLPSAEKARPNHFASVRRHHRAERLAGPSVEEPDAAGIIADGKSALDATRAESQPSLSRCRS